MSMFDHYASDSFTAAASTTVYDRSPAGLRPRSRSAVIGALSPSEQRQLLDIQRQRRLLLGPEQADAARRPTGVVGTTGSSLSTPPSPQQTTDCQYGADGTTEIAAKAAQVSVRSRSHSGGVGVGHLPDQLQFEMLLLAQLQQQRQLVEYMAGKAGAAPAHLDVQRQATSGRAAAFEADDVNRSFVAQQQQQQPQPTSAAHASSTDRFKTELCRSYAESGGTCRYGDKCQFAHGPAELRSVERHPRYKTELCKTFHSRGFCAYGPRCHFIHNISETRLPSPALLEEIYQNPELYGPILLPQLVGGGLPTSHSNTLGQAIPPLSSRQQQQQQQQQMPWYGPDFGPSSATNGQHRRLSLDNRALAATSGLLPPTPHSPQQHGFDVHSLSWQASMLANATSNWAVSQQTFFAADEKFRSRSVSLGSAASRSMYSGSSGSSSPGPPSPPCTSGGDMVDDLMQRAASAEQIAAYLEHYRRMHVIGGASMLDVQLGPRLM